MGTVLKLSALKNYNIDQHIDKKAADTVAFLFFVNCIKALYI